MGTEVSAWEERSPGGYGHTGLPGAHHSVRVSYLGWGGCLSCGHPQSLNTLSIKYKKLHVA